MIVVLSLLNKKLVGFSTISHGAAVSAAVVVVVLTGTLEEEQQDPPLQSCQYCLDPKI
jgi:hypothetical protein